MLFLSFLTVNTLFALAYFSLGPGQLAGGDAPSAGGRFLNALFFSAHTLSTVGYGNIAPQTVASNSLSAFEAMVGLMGIAVATGLLYGRFSPVLKAKIAAAAKLLIDVLPAAASVRLMPSTLPLS